MTYKNKIALFPQGNSGQQLQKDAGTHTTNTRYRKALEPVLRSMSRAKNIKLNQQDHIENTAFYASLSPLGFEAICAELFAMMGFEVELVGADTDAGDGGKDLILTMHGRYKIYVQCKNFWASRNGSQKGVGQDVMQNLVGATYDRREDNDAAILITSGTVTPTARLYAQNNFIVTIDGVMLEKLGEEVGLFCDSPSNDPIIYN